MKKYISISSLAAALVIQSCERNDSDLNDQEQNLQKIEFANLGEFAREEDISSEENNSSNSKNGEDDPPRDKQHWRAINDTIH